MAFRWWANDSLLLVLFGSSSYPLSAPYQQNKKKIDKTYWIRACWVSTNCFPIELYLNFMFVYPQNALVRTHIIYKTSVTENFYTATLLHSRGIQGFLTSRFPSASTSRGLFWSYFSRDADPVQHPGSISHGHPEYYTCIYNHNAKIMPCYSNLASIKLLCLYLVQHMLH